ncbi:hypothetical protein BD626DRAFT_5703 [Schizophyllum amplum]|uniref:Uncharacterized protein n=1 Tax=Schizophyllum amplum TaxID=97359 RepID=A0A550CWD0_9AGAR|nr:hypothetical protein BD626DRAFT_5703 [Auriculariopsis ampla]
MALSTVDCQRAGRSARGPSLIFSDFPRTMSVNNPHPCSSAWPATRSTYVAARGGRSRACTSPQAAVYLQFLTAKCLYPAQSSSRRTYTLIWMLRRRRPRDKAALSKVEVTQDAILLSSSEGLFWCAVALLLSARYLMIKNGLLRLGCADRSRAGDGEAPGKLAVPAAVQMIGASCMMHLANTSCWPRLTKESEPDARPTPPRVQRNGPPLLRPPSRLRALRT